MKKYLSLFGAIVVLDLFAKQWAVWRCPESVAINRGISWSLLSPSSTTGFVIISIAIALFVGFFMWYTWKRFQQHEAIFAEVLICAGALSNLIDRPLHGGVVDFISLGFCTYQWPLFNLADIAIVSGVFLILTREVCRK